jgi:hypothetical protein
MSYTEFKALLKKINLKPKGVKEIVLEVSDGALHGKIDLLSEMLDSRVAIAIDSEVVRYNVQINTRTEKPITTYRVDESGVVSEVKPEGEQMELDLNVPKMKDSIADIPEEIGREVVDEFILSGLAPQPKGFYPLAAWIGRITDGETYLKIAGEEGMSSGRVVDLIDEYRQFVAPMAAKWDEWRKAKAEEVEDLEDDEDDHQASPSEETPNYAGKVILFQTNAGTQLLFPIEGEYARAPKKFENGVFAHTMGEGEVFNAMGVRAVPIAETGGWIGYLVSELISFGGELIDNLDATETPTQTEGATAQREAGPAGDDISDWEQGIMGGGDQGGVPSGTTEFLDVESIILTEKPQFEDIPYDFPALLQRKKSGETWMDIANSIGTRSTVLSAAWTKYKKRVQEQRGGAA